MAFLFLLPLLTHSFELYQDDYSIKNITIPETETYIIHNNTQQNIQVSYKAGQILNSKYSTNYSFCSLSSLQITYQSIMQTELIDPMLQADVNYTFFYNKLKNQERIQLQENKKTNMINASDGVIIQQQGKLIKYTDQLGLVFQMDLQQDAMICKQIIQNNEQFCEIVLVIENMIKCLNNGQLLPIQPAEGIQDCIQNENLLINVFKNQKISINVLNQDQMELKLEQQLLEEPIKDISVINDSSDKRYLLILTQTKVQLYQIDSDYRSLLLVFTLNIINGLKIKKIAWNRIIIITTRRQQVIGILVKVNNLKLNIEQTLYLESQVEDIWLYEHFVIFRQKNNLNYVNVYGDHFQDCKGRLFENLSNFISGSSEVIYVLQKELLNKYKLIIENPVIECHRQEGDLLNEVVDMKIVYNSTCPDQQQESNNVICQYLQNIQIQFKDQNISKTDDSNLGLILGLLFGFLVLGVISFFVARYFYKKRQLKEQQANKKSSQQVNQQIGQKEDYQENSSKEDKENNKIELNL